MKIWTKLGTPVITPMIEQSINGSNPIRKWDDRIKNEVLENLTRIQERKLMRQALAPEPILSAPSKGQRVTRTMKTFRIASTIKMRTRTDSSKLFYPFAEMKVGDSFEAPKKSKSAVYAHNKKHPETLFEWQNWSAKKKTIRIWRTK